MEDNKDFTFDQTRFPNFGDFVKTEQGKGLHFITILDPALVANEGDKYLSYKTGLEEDVFIKWNSNIELVKRLNPPGVDTSKDIIFGWVWPKGPVAFPDFLKSKTKPWWNKEVSDYWNKVNYDGIWLDMNEPANFETNSEAKPFYCETADKCWSLKCPKDAEELIPFLPEGMQGSISTKTLCMQSVQGDAGKLYKFSDVHSLYGLFQTEATYDGMSKNPNLGPPLIVTRSTYPSSGKYSGHWLGDNRSQWKYLHRSIIGMLEFSLFAISYTGADICGFFDNAEPEMCARWMQLGAFYPFMRNHNSMGQKDQDPVGFLNGTEYFKWVKNALETRYTLIPYLQTLHFLANRDGSTVVRPMFHEFPLDSETHGIDRQFMWGPALLISPVLDEGKDNLRYYLPEEEWYDYHTKTKINSEGKFFEATGLLDENNMVPLHVRGGHILPTKKTSSLNTKESESVPFVLHVYPKNGMASGEWFKSDSAKKVTDVNHFHAFGQNKLNYNNCEFTMEIIKTGTNFGDLKIDSIWIYGFNKTSSPPSVFYDFTIEGVNTNDVVLTEYSEKLQGFKIPFVQDLIASKPKDNLWRIYWGDCQRKQV